MTITPPHLIFASMLENLCEETDSSRQARIIADGLRGKTDADYPGCTEGELVGMIEEVKGREQCQ
jgi:hypothetical protein